MEGCKEAAAAWQRPPASNPGAHAHVGTLGAMTSQAKCLPAIPHRRLCVERHAAEGTGRRLRQKGRKACMSPKPSLTLQPLAAVARADAPCA